MQKKAKAPEPAGESAPMWIVSFADLVTLLMSFFVVLYALKQGGAKQQLETAAAIRMTFDPNYIPPPDSNSPFDQEILRLKFGKAGPPLPNNGGNSPKPTDGQEGRDNQVSAIRPGKQIVAGGKITFGLNDSDLDDESRAAIKQLAEKLRGKTNVLFIKGHVSADEIRTEDPGGMKLSDQRAEKVIDEFVRLGIERRVMRPLACGPFEPIRTGVYDSASLRQNRRVEIYATENTASEYVPVNTVPAIDEPAEKKP